MDRSMSAAQSAWDNRMPPDDAPDMRVSDGEDFWSALEAGRDVLMPMDRHRSECKAISTLLGQTSDGLDELLFRACHLAAKRVLPELQREQDARAGAALRAFAEAVCNAYAETVNES